MKRFDYLVALVALVAPFGGCGSSSNPNANHDASVDSFVQRDATADATVDAGPLIQYLYVCNDRSMAGVLQYSLPLTASSTPNFTIPISNTVAVAFNGSGDMMVGDNAGNIELFPPPISAESTPMASFRNGSAGGNGQLVFTPGGVLVAPSSVGAVNLFTPPFSNTSIPSSSISSASFDDEIGAAFDSSGNLYVGGFVSTTASVIAVYAPPYTGTPVIATVTGASYRKIAVTATQLFVTNLASGDGSIDVFTLPITESSVPAFTITNGVDSPEAIAADALGNLYVGNLSDSTVSVFSPPFSASSDAALSFPIVLTPVAEIFGVTIGP